MTINFQEIDQQEEIEVLKIQKDFFFKKIDSFIIYIDNTPQDRTLFSVSFSENYNSLNQIKKVLINTKSYFEKNTFDKDNSHFKKMKHLFNLFPKIDYYFLQIDFMDDILNQLQQHDIEKIKSILLSTHKDIATYHYNILYPVFEPFNSYNLHFYKIIYSLVGFDIFSNSYLKFHIKNSLLEELLNMEPNFYSKVSEKKSIIKLLKDF